MTAEDRKHTWIIIGVITILFIVSGIFHTCNGKNSMTGTEKCKFNPYLKYITPKRIQQEISIKTEKIVREIIVREMQSDLEQQRVAAKREDLTPGLAIINPKSKLPAYNIQGATNGKNTK